MSSRWLVVALLVLAAACGDPTPVSTPAPDGVADVDDAPALVVTDEGVVSVVSGGEHDVIGEIEGATLAVADGSGGYVVQRELEQGRSHLIAMTADGTSSEIDFPAADRFELFDVVDALGGPRVLYATNMTAADVETTGDVMLGDIPTGAVVSVGPAFGPEFFTAHASYADGVVVVSSYCDLSECIEYRDLEGQPYEDIPNPAADLAYNAPPLLVFAHLSPDGSTMAYLEGPDVDGVNDPELRVGDWVLVVQDQEDGSEQVRMTFAGRNVDVTHFDYDGRWAVVSSEDDDGVALEVQIIDTSAPSGPVGASVDGRATIV